jgi:hypothetical protein
LILSGFLFKCSIAAVVFEANLFATGMIRSIASRCQGAAAPQILQLADGLADSVDALFDPIQFFGMALP